MTIVIHTRQFPAALTYHLSSMSSSSNRKTDYNKLRSDTDGKDAIMGDVEQLEQLASKTKNIRLTDKNDFEGFKQAILETIGTLSDTPTMKELVDAHFKVCYFFAENYEYEHTNTTLFDCTVQQYCDNIFRVCNEIVVELGRGEVKRSRIVTHILAPLIRKCKNESTFFP